MNKNDHEKFSKVFTVLCQSYGKELDTTREKVYWQNLESHPIETVEKAAKMAMQKCKFFPSIAEFVELIEGADDEKASTAWYKYLDVLYKIGPEKTVDLEDRVAHQVLIEMELWGDGIERKGYPDDRITGQMIPSQRDDGLYYIPQRKDETAYLRAEFIKRYRYYLRTDAKLLPAKLPGFYEEENKRQFALTGANWTPGQIEAARNGYLPPQKQPAIATQEKKALPDPPKTPKTETPLTDEERKATGAEIQKFIASMSSRKSVRDQRRWLTDGEIAERKRLIQEQFKLVKDE